MSPKLKYVRTQDDVIIIFPEYIVHRDFFRFNPKSAGFVEIDIEFTSPPDTDMRIRFTCFGESQSLKLKSIPEEDSKLAQRQFGDAANGIF